MNIVNVENLSFSYEENIEVLKDISFKIKKGSYTTIVGHNGSGKSTLAKLLMGLLKADKGIITIKDIILNEDSVYEIRDYVGVVFQNPDNQFIGSTVADDIAFGLENKLVESEKMPAIIETYAQKVGMFPYLQSEPTKLSGGQKQRVAIAGVLAMDLNVIIFDEATSMLDPKGKEDIKTLIKELHINSEMTIISITHDMEEVTNSDFVVILSDGKVLDSGEPSTVLYKEDLLKQAKLDLPYALKLQKALEAVDLKVDKNIQLEEVVENLCQLYLND